MKISIMYLYHSIKMKFKNIILASDLKDNFLKENEIENVNINFEIKGKDLIA